jgi:hypothetical protein
MRVKTSEEIQAEQADSGSFSFLHSPLAILAAK